MADTDSPPANLEDQAERIARELTIPPCPAILVRFAAEMKKEDPDLRLLATLIGNDVALSAAIINTVNSPFYGGRRKASNVQQALYVLGLQRSAHLIARLLLRNAFPAGSGAMMQHFWDESTRMATTADDLAPHIAGIDGDIAHTYALFRDCGKAVMIAKFTDLRRRGRRSPRHGARQSAAGRIRPAGGAGDLDSRRWRAVRRMGGQRGVRAGESQA